MSLVDFINGNSPLEELCRTVFMQLRLYYPWNKYYLKKMNKQQSHPYMIEARRFFSENASRVDRVMKLLCDDISKDTFNKLVHMRQFYALNDIPQYNYFDQYFPKDIIKYTDNEVFVDGGAFTGDSFMKFIKLCPNYKRIVAFEPDKNNICRMRRKCRKVRDLVIIEKGMSDSTRDGNFLPNKTGMYSQFVDDKTGLSVPLIKIDDVSECSDATFIKMDIEGSELAALKGAEKTIKRNKPKLAICIYHSNEDMLRIAEYVHEIVPEYSIYMRAHNMGIAENVMYAICNS